MKKILSSILISIFLIGSIWITNSSNNSNSFESSIKTSVLNWSTFTKSKREEQLGKPLKCEDNDIITITSKSKDELEVWYEENKDQKWYISDVKWCLLEEVVDSYATWFIFLWIIILIWHWIFLGIKVAIWSEWDSGWMWGWMWGMWGMWGWMWAQGGWIMWQLKKPLIWIAILVVILVGWLNVILSWLKWLVDLFIR